MSKKDYPTIEGILEEFDEEFKETEGRRFDFNSKEGYKYIKQFLRTKLEELLEYLDFEEGKVYDSETKEVFYHDDAVKELKEKLERVNSQAVEH